jgi:hypothetical protein
MIRVLTLLMLAQAKTPEGAFVLNAWTLVVTARDGGFDVEDLGTHEHVPGSFDGQVLTVPNGRVRLEYGPDGAVVMAYGTGKGTGMTAPAKRLSADELERRLHPPQPPRQTPQQEAVAGLKGVFVAERAFYAERDRFVADLDAIGFKP